MTPALQALITSATCRFCNGEGELHSAARRYADGPVWHTHLDCAHCRGSGVDPDFMKETSDA